MLSRDISMAAQGHDTSFAGYMYKGSPDIFGKHMAIICSLPPKELRAHEREVASSPTAPSPRPPDPR
jgi:hypothetical protein